MSLLTNAVSKELIEGLEPEFKKTILNFDQTKFKEQLVKQSYGLWNSFNVWKRSTFEYDSVKGHTESN